MTKVTSFKSFATLVLSILLLRGTESQDDKNLTAECANFFRDSLKIGTKVVKEEFPLNRTGKRFVIALLLPNNQSFPYSLYKVQASVRLGIIQAKKTYLAPDFELDLFTEDTKCSEIFGPLNAMKLFLDAPNRPNVFLGPNCVYVLSMVARFSSSPIWSIPVISTGAQFEGFDNQKDYGFLIRILSSYSKLGLFLVQLYRHFGWNVAGILFANLRKHTECHSLMSPVNSIFMKARLNVTHLQFREKFEAGNKLRSLDKVDELLHDLSLSARSI